MSREFETVLATHCAPLLFGKKPAILIQDAPALRRCDWDLLRHHGLRVLRMRKRQGNSLVFVYNPALLGQTLNRPLVRRSLSSFGYECETLTALLDELQRRVLTSREFPHEIGFFLGYPPEDVLAFIAERDGDCRKCELCGTWKVYGDAASAAATFDEYAHYRRTLLQEIAVGRSIFNVIPSALAG